MARFTQGLLDALMETGDRLICEEFARTGGVQQRGVYISDDRPFSVPLEWSDPASKVLAVSRFKERLRQKKARYYLLLGEAWIAPWPERGDLIVPASKSDKRVEIIYAMAVEMDGGNVFGKREINTMLLTSPPTRSLGPLSRDVNLEGFFA